MTNTTIVTITANANLFPGRVIPDGQGGHIATWVYSPFDPPADPNPFRAAHITAGVTLYNLPILPAVAQFVDGVPVQPELVLGEGDTAFATYGAGLVAFNTLTGLPQWRYAAAGPISIVSQLQGNGVAAAVSTGASGTLYRFDNSGQFTTETLSGNASGTQGTETLIASPFAFSAIQGTAPMAPSSLWFAPQMGGGNEAVRFVYLLDPVNDPQDPKQIAIRSVLLKLKTALENESPTASPSCGQFLTKQGVTGLTVISAYLLNLNRIGHGLIRTAPIVSSPSVNWIDAFTGARNATKLSDDVGVPITWSVSVNRDGLFFNSSVQIGGRLETRYIGPAKYVGGSIQGQALILLHETAHVLSCFGSGANESCQVIPPDFGTAAQPNQSELNTTTVYTACKSLLEGLTP